VSNHKSIVSQGKGRKREFNIQPCTSPSQQKKDRGDHQRGEGSVDVHLATTEKNRGQVHLLISLKKEGGAWGKKKKKKNSPHSFLLYAKILKSGCKVGVNKGKRGKGREEGRPSPVRIKELKKKRNGRNPHHHDYSEFRSKRENGQTRASKREKK